MDYIFLFSFLSHLLFVLIWIIVSNVKSMDVSNSTVVVNDEEYSSHGDENIDDDYEDEFVEMERLEKNSSESPSDFSPPPLPLPGSSSSSSKVKTDDIHDGVDNDDGDDHSDIEVEEDSFCN